MGIDVILFIDTDLTTNHIVFGLLVPMDIDLTDPHHLPFLDGQNDGCGPVLHVRNHIGRDLGKRIALAPIEIVQPRNLVTKFLTLKNLPFLNLEPLAKFRIFEHRIPAESDFADGERLSFRHRVRNDKPLLIVAEFHSRQSDSGV